jgi:subtilisin family serine protease
MKATCVLVACAAILAAPSAQAADDPAVASGYIVVLKAGVDSGAVAALHAERYGVEVGFVYDGHALYGYSATISPNALAQVRDDPNVDYVERDGIATAWPTQTGATWGIDRIDQRTRPLSGTFTYNNTGAGVRAYIIDTGIRFTHTDFGGRAISGFDAIDGGAATDCNGHGTHVAGTVGGARWGVAKGVTLVAVRVLNCSGSGSWSQVIAGINWVTSDHGAGQRAVANMSLGGGASSSVDQAVNNSITDGVSYAVAAGNSNANACNFSPARVPAAMTIGATTSTDARASFSNWGSCVDWFAPGVSITSAWYTSDTATRTISGTSMASPHTAGVAAQYLQPAFASPATVRSALFNLTTKGIVTGSNSTNNHLLFTNL